MNPAPGAIWTAMALVLVLSMALGILSNLLLPVPPEIASASPILGLQARPLLATAIQGLFLILLAGGIATIGRRFGGRGGFDLVLVLVVWMEFVLVCLQAVQVLLLVVLPPLATLVGIAGFALFFWFLTAFTAEVHGFRSLPQVFMGLLVGLIVTALVAAVVFVFLGVMPMPQAAP